MGDRNIAFFHSKASQRFRMNYIHGLRDQAGELCYGDDNVAALLVDYYKSLFIVAYPSNIDVALQSVPTGYHK